MGQILYQVDAFSDVSFKGNPAAVCILEESRDETWMQNVAAEMNLSETAFLREEKDGFDLRWFTPKVEVDLCGHATLASAHVLWELGRVSPRDRCRFHSPSGLLRAEKQGDWIELDFPALEEAETAPPEGLTEALGVDPRYVGRSREDYLVEVESEDIVRALHPDFQDLEAAGIRGVMVTSRAATPGYDFVSRFFGPGFGINEDPVTGAAHCCLGPFWGERLGKEELVAYQASERGGTVRVRLGEDRVYLGGKAVTVFIGELR